MGRPLNYRQYPWLATIISCILACCSSCNVRPRGAELYRDARQAFRDANWNQALDLAREASKHCKPDSECYWSARLLEAKVLLSDHQPDAAAAVLSEAPPQSPQFAALAATHILLEGDLQRAWKRPERAEELYSKARQKASSAGAWDVISEVDLIRARLLFESHHDAEGAIAVFRDVAEQSVRRQDPYYEAHAVNRLGVVLLTDGRFDEAIPWFQRTIEAARKARVQGLIVVASLNLMICYYRLGSFDDADKSYRQAINLLGENGPANYRMKLSAQRGNTLLFQGKVHEAIDCYRQAVGFARDPRMQLAIIGTWRLPIHLSRTGMRPSRAIVRPYHTAMTKTSGDTSKPAS
jgi:tetratricopeptide (TPR) repeat protein